MQELIFILLADWTEGGKKKRTSRSLKESEEALFFFGQEISSGHSILPMKHEARKAMKAIVKTQTNTL
jgi:hypothetical protein